MDSCIGGKTGVNSKFGKNLIGSFYNPKVVIVETEFLNRCLKEKLYVGMLKF